MKKIPKKLKRLPAPRHARPDLRSRDNTVEVVALVLDQQRVGSAYDQARRSLEIALIDLQRLAELEDGIIGETTHTTHDALGSLQKALFHLDRDKLDDDDGACVHCGGDPDDHMHVPPSERPS